MELRPWNPWQELERVEEEIDSLLGSVLAKIRRSVPGKAIAFVPPTDITEAPGEYRLYFSLPGMVEEDIDITLDGNILILRGEREPPYDPEQTTFHQRQWKYGYFERRVELPGKVDTDAIQATYDAGVLTVRVRKGAAPSPGGDSPEGPAGGVEP
jgi:HSP20 family protein